MKSRNLSLLVVVTFAAAFFNARTALAAEADRVLPVITPVTQPFEPGDVRLLDGPFKDAMDVDGRYLLSLEPDRLLSGFRSEAGLKQKGEKYGGWESTGLAGQSTGHYLSACARIYQDTGDSRYLDRVNYIVDELAECQKANGNGYVEAIPGGKKIFAEIAAGDVRSQGFDLNGGWVPWYNLHKLFAGLIDSYRYNHERLARLEVVTNLANWAGRHHQKPDRLGNGRPALLACEQGGMNESLANLYVHSPATPITWCSPGNFITAPSWIRSSPAAGTSSTGCIQTCKFLKTTGVVPAWMN